MFDVDGLNTTDKQPPCMPGPNQELANAMGIVMGTSHHEPMSRNKPEWDAWSNGAWDWHANQDGMTEWWTYGAERAKGMETMFTMGMRGDGDEELTGASNELVENITSAQLGMLANVYGKENVNDIPKMWAMYKEVANYYLHGLKVPEDIMILFADDNYGNIMAVNPPDDPHPAGAGIYHHVDYVGYPRVYKWINTISNAKTWEQMNIARSFNTTAIWITNIGSLKPLEMPANFFLDLGWDMDRWSVGTWGEWLEMWAAREFGLQGPGKHEIRKEVRAIMEKYQMLSYRHKAELMGEDTFSLLNYEEAERVLADWNDLVARATAVDAELGEAYKAPFFENVYMLCLMQANLNKMYMAAARSNQYAIQARTSANIYAWQAIHAFHQDANLTQMFHSMLDGKWDHMLDQTHINFLMHHEPLRDTLPPISMVQPNQPSRIGIPLKERTTGLTAYVRVTVEGSLGSWPGENMYNCLGWKCPDPTLLPMDQWGARRRWVDVGSGGPKDIRFQVRPTVDWLKASSEGGVIKRDGSTDQRIYLEVDWAKVPKGATEGQVHIAAADRSNVTITVPIFTPPLPSADFNGFVQGDGYVVMEAAHYSASAPKDGYSFVELPGYGRTLSGLEMLPASIQNFTAGEGPSVTYNFWAHPSASKNETAEILLQFGPSLNFISGKELAIAVQLDDGKVHEIHPIPTDPLKPVVSRPGMKPYDVGAVPSDWFEAVKQEIRNATLNLDVHEGAHQLKVYGMTTGLVLERLLVDFGGIKERGYSYLGPLESVLK
jgi:hypothetical protein